MGGWIHGTRTSTVLEDIIAMVMTAHKGKNWQEEDKKKRGNRR